MGVARALLLLWLAGPVWADCFVDAQRGSDRADGSRQRPWKTLAHAVSAAPARATLRASGTFRETDVRILRPLTLVGPARVLAERSGNALEVRASRVTFDNLEVQGGIWAVSLAGGNRQVRLRNLVLSRAEAGVHMTADVEDVEIVNCTVSGCVYTALDATPGPVRQLTIRGCTIRGNGREAGYGGDGVAVERGRDVLIEDCLIADNGGDGIDLGSRNLAPTEGFVVRRCRVSANGKNGLKLWWGGQVENCLVSGSGGTGVVLANAGRYLLNACTVVENARQERDYSLTAGYDGHPSQDVTLTNCLFAFNGPPDQPTGLFLGGDTRLTQHHNLFYSRAECELEQAGQDVPRERLPGSADPRLEADHRPGPLSPCRGAADPGTAPATDLAGQPRKRPDVGALEGR